MVESPSAATSADHAASLSSTSYLAGETARLRLKLITLSAENERLRETISFQLGGLILRARTWRGLLDLPKGLWRLRKQSRRLRGHHGAGIDRGLEARIQRLISLAPEMSAEEIAAKATLDCRSDELAARVVADLALAFKPIDFPKSLDLARRVLVLDPQGRNQLWLGNFLFDAGMIDEPHRLITRARKEGGLVSPAIKNRIAVLEGLMRVRDNGLSLKPRRPHGRSTDRSVLYVAASSYPHHISGYAARTHSLLKALGKTGWRIEAVTRPGYPHDRNDAASVGPHVPFHEVDGVTYGRLRSRPSTTTPFDQYCAEASQGLLGYIRKTRPAIIHAASNHVNALPALMAAREAGLPFIYEVRGLWELSHAARVPHWEGSQRFEQQRHIETLTANEADAVVTISQGLKGELVRRGVDAAKIVVVPNSVDTDKFQPREKDQDLVAEYGLTGRHVFGFIGSMTAYEGLVDLVSALAQLRATGVDACLLLVGDGPVFREVREAARNLGVIDHLIMPGKVPPLQTPRWYSVMDVAVYPRVSAMVTELVPPLKPLEAMAMEIPVVASNLDAIRETVIDGKNGFLFERGDIDDLTRVLAAVVRARGKADRIGQAARQDVQARFTWAQAAATLDDLYARYAG